MEDSKESVEKLEIETKFLTKNEEDAHKSKIVNIQWFPSWCQFDVNGKIQNEECNKIVYFATGSSDGSIFIWKFSPYSSDDDEDSIIENVYKLFIKDLQNDKILFSVT